MRYALSVPNFIPHALADGNPIDLFVGWARAAEQAGWDGFFIWDHILFWKPDPLHVFDPWVLMAAMAAATQGIKLGPMVCPLPRRRPWKVARETVTLDHLSQGRLILGVGIGAPLEAENTPFGEPDEMPRLARRLDESLDVITGLWTGEPFSYHGQQLNVDDVRFLPRPLQEPRIPIWVAALWPKHAPMRRAARWDGVFPLKMEATGVFGSMTPDDVREMRTYIGEHRTSRDPFDIVVGGGTRSKAHTDRYAEAGVTWWIEGADWFNYKSPEHILRRIEDGPPR